MRRELSSFAIGSDVSAFFSSFGDLEAHSQQTSEGVRIALDANDVLVLVGVFDMFVSMGVLVR